MEILPLLHSATFLGFAQQFLVTAHHFFSPKKIKKSSLLSLRVLLAKHHHPSAANWTARLRLSKLLFNQRRGITCRWSHGGGPWKGWDNWGWFYHLFVWFTSITSNGWALLAACATTPLLQTGRPGWAFQSFSSTKGAASPAGEAMEWRCWDNWGWFYNVFVWGRSWGLRYCLPLEVWFPSFRWNVVYAGTTPI